MQDHSPSPGTEARTVSATSGEHTRHHKKIRSFVMRAGRTTTAQQEALDTLSAQFVLPYQDQAIDLAAAFGRDADTILEIGFGMGDATAHIARQRPDENFLCCEVHIPGVGALLKRIRDENIQNIRIIQHDAVEVLQNMLPMQALSGVHIFFPDPWHKKRHHKRRLIQAPFIELLLPHIRPGGYLHSATDWEEYAQQMLSVLEANPVLHNLGQLDSGYAERPWYRPITKFEQRGRRLGHGVWDVLFTTSPSAN